MAQIRQYAVVFQDLLPEDTSAEAAHSQERGDAPLGRTIVDGVKVKPDADTQAAAPPPLSLPPPPLPTKSPKKGPLAFHCNVVAVDSSGKFVASAGTTAAADTGRGASESRNGGCSRRRAKHLAAAALLETLLRAEEQEVQEEEQRVAAEKAREAESEREKVMQMQRALSRTNAQYHHLPLHSSTTASTFTAATSGTPGTASTKRRTVWDGSLRHREAGPPPPHCPKMEKGPQLSCNRQEMTTDSGRLLGEGAATLPPPDLDSPADGNLSAVPASPRKKPQYPGTPDDDQEPRLRLLPVPSPPPPVPAPPLPLPSPHLLPAPPAIEGFLLPRQMDAYPRSAPWVTPEWCPQLGRFGDPPTLVLTTPTLL